MEQNHRATRKDVAELAGVSVATVSYVLNHTKSVSPSVEERVRKAAKVLHYTPNLVARSLITKRSMHVAILVDNLKNPYYTRLLVGAQKVALEKGYMVALLMQDYMNRENMEQLASRQIDGMIVTTQEWRKIARKMKTTLPCIFPQDLGGKQFIDYQEAMTESVRCLKQYGHKRVAALCGLVKDTSDHRIRNLQEALANEGMEVDEDLFVWPSDKEETTIEKGYRDMEELLSRGKTFSAVYALNDLMAIGAIRCLRDHKIRVPEDVSVWGCDNDERDQDIDPQLASIDVSAEQRGEDLMQALLAAIEGREFEIETIQAKFIERASIGPCRQGY